MNAKAITVAAMSTIFIASISTGHTFAQPSVYIVGAMKNVMWKGQLEATVSLDTIKNKSGLYGLGPEAFLTGEVLINDGRCFVSRVTSDSTMIVEETYQVQAPFFVYSNVNAWHEMAVPTHVVTLKDLEAFIEEQTKGARSPFTFKLIGQVATAVIHVQNLPKGSKVSSPQDAHQGQVQFTLQNDAVEIIGYFSKTHQGIFTHHDSFIHMHLITKDKKKMGHVDDVHIKQGKMKLLIEKR